MPLPQLPSPAALDAGFRACCKAWHGDRDGSTPARRGGNRGGGRRSAGRDRACRGRGHAGAVAGGKARRAARFRRRAPRGISAPTGSSGWSRRPRRRCPACRTNPCSTAPMRPARPWRRCGRGCATWCSIRPARPSPRSRLRRRRWAVGCARCGRVARPRTARPYTGGCARQARGLVDRCGPWCRVTACNPALNPAAPYQSHERANPCSSRPKVKEILSWYESDNPGHQGEPRPHPDGREARRHGASW